MLWAEKHLLKHFSVILILRASAEIWDVELAIVWTEVQLVTWMVYGPWCHSHTGFWVISCSVWREGGGMGGERGRETEREWERARDRQTDREKEGPGQSTCAWHRYKSQSKGAAPWDGRGKGSPPPYYSGMGSPRFQRKLNTRVIFIAVTRHQGLKA